MFATQKRPPVPRLSARRFAWVPALAVAACAAMALFRGWGAGQAWATRTGPAWAVSRAWPARTGRARLLAPPALAPAAAPPPTRPPGPLTRARHAFEMPPCGGGGDGRPSSTPRAVIVSGMWAVPTRKRSPEQYTAWLANLAALNAPLVFFGDSASAQPLADARARLGFAEDTVVIGTEVGGLACANTPAGMGLWAEQAELCVGFGFSFFTMGWFEARDRAGLFRALLSPASRRGHRPPRDVAPGAPSLILHPSHSHLFFSSLFQLSSDPEAVLHSPPLYAVWCSKAALLASVAEAGCFGGTHFFWYDAGAFRGGPPPGSPAALEAAAAKAALAAANAAAAAAAAAERGLAPPPVPPHVAPAPAPASAPIPPPWRPALLAALPAGRLVGTLVSRALPADALRLDPATGTPLAPLGRAGRDAEPLLRDVVAAGGFGGDAAGVKAFASAFYAMADAFLEQGFFVGKEQNVMTAACIAHPRLCALLPGGWFDFHKKLAYAADPAAAVASLESLPDAARVESRRRAFHF
jgi:hypothetical protein